MIYPATLPVSSADWTVIREPQSMHGPPIVMEHTCLRPPKFGHPVGCIGLIESGMVQMIGVLGLKVSYFAGRKPIVGPS